MGRATPTKRFARFSVPPSDRMETAIRQLRRKTDIVVVSFHWGKEGQTTPEPYQVVVAHRAIESGAHIVVGHHPHRIQGIEFYKGGVILYSLGNFLFPGSSRVESFLAEVVVTQIGVKSVRILPIWVSGGRPVPSSDSRLVGAIREVLAAVGSGIDVEGAWLNVERR